VLEKQHQVEESALDSAAVSAFLSGEPLPAEVSGGKAGAAKLAKKLEKLSVAQLRQQLTKDAGRRKQAAAAAEKAAEELKARAALHPAPRGAGG
jgi:hypothetical protein